MRALAWLVSVAALAPSIASVNAGPLYCTTSFQGYRVCDNGHDYRSTELSRDGMRFGQNSEGNRRATSRWQDPDNHSHAAARPALRSRFGC